MSTTVLTRIGDSGGVVSRQGYWLCYATIGTEVQVAAPMMAMLIVDGGGIAGGGGSADRRSQRPDASVDTACLEEWSGPARDWE
jgi:hypothetical protein